MEFLYKVGEDILDLEQLEELQEGQELEEIVDGEIELVNNYHITVQFTHCK